MPVTASDFKIYHNAILSQREQKIRPTQSKTEIWCRGEFDEMYMPNARGTGKTKVRFAVFVLSHSRYKFAYFQSRPFHTVDLITAMTVCFRYFDGMRDEIVVDQDSIVCVSENSGDIILTYEFEKFRQQCGFKVYMCRAADPESKGMVENAVRY